MMHIGMTFSHPDMGVVYSNYDKTKNKNLFEEVVDQVILDKYSEDKDLTEYIKTLNREDKRMSILSLLDGDHGMWVKLNTLIKGNKVSKIDHLKEVIGLFRQFVKIADVERKLHGEVMSPIDELVKPMIKLVPEEFWTNPNHKILDSSAGIGTFPILCLCKLMSGLKDWEPDVDKRFKHIVENMLYYGELQARNVFLYLCALDPNDEYDLNIYWGSFLDEGFDKHMKNVWNVEKFDLTIQNPPFKRKMNLKFLDKSMNISDMSVFVHPSSWLIDEKNANNDFRKSRSLHSDTLDKVILFNGNKMFNIGLYIPMAITYINKSKKTKGIKVIDEINDISIIYSDINEINKYSNMSEYRSIINKLSSSKKISELYNKVGNYYVNMSRIRGHVYENGGNKMYCDDFYTTITKDEKVSSEITKSVYFGFDDEIKANNFLKYLKTNFVRFCLSICKNSADLNKIDFSMIPKLDYSIEWTDDKLSKFFNLSSDEVDFINKNIPKYYDI